MRYLTGQNHPHEDQSLTLPEPRQPVYHSSIQLCFDLDERSFSKKLNKTEMFDKAELSILNGSTTEKPIITDQETLPDRDEAILARFGKKQRLRVSCTLSRKDESGNTGLAETIWFSFSNRNDYYIDDNVGGNYWVSKTLMPSDEIYRLLTKCRNQEHC